MLADHPDDLVLLRHFRERDDQQAFTELVTRHVDLVYGTAYRLLRDTQLSEDASQRVFTALARKGKRQDIKHVSSWLYAVTQREVRSMIRSESRRSRREREAFELEMLAQLSGQDREASVEVLSGVLGDALKRLSDSDQQALFLRFYEEQEFREIGTTLGIEERAAQKRVYRAMDRLRGDLKKRGIVATAAIFSGQLFTAGACPAPDGLAASVSTHALAAAKPLSLATALESIRWSSVLLVGGTVATLGVGAMAWKPANLSTLQQAPSTASLVADRHTTTSPNSLAIDDIEGIYHLQPRPKEAALTKLIDHLQPLRDDDYLADLFARWTRLDPTRNAQGIVEIASKLTDTEREPQWAELLTIPLQAWWATNPTEVESWQQSLSRNTRGERVAFTSLIQIVSQTAPLHAFTLVANRAGTGKAHYEILADGFAQVGIDHARDLLTKLPETEPAQVPSTLSDTVLFEESADTPVARLYEGLMPRFFESDPQATADWVTTLPEVDEFEGITSAFVSLWAEHAPADAATWATSEHPSALPAVVQAWLSKDEAQAKDWLAPQAEAPTSGELFGIAADQLGPEPSIAWANQLGDTPGATQLIRHAFFSMGKQESNNTLNDRLDGVAAEATRTHAATALAQGLLVKQGRGAVAAWRKSIQKKDPTLSQALFLGELDVMAAINPRAAASTILEQPPSSDRDQAISILLSRTINRGQAARDLAQSWLNELSDSALKRKWYERIEEVGIQAPRILPERLPSGSDAQTYGEFHERLDLLSTYPLKAQ